MYHFANRKLLIFFLFGNNFILHKLVFPAVVNIINSERMIDTTEIFKGQVA